MSWPGTRGDREDVLARLSVPSLHAANAVVQRKRLIGVELLLDWITQRPGGTWQQRWLASEAAVTGQAWQRVRSAWLAEHDHFSR